MFFRRVTHQNGIAQDFQSNGGASPSEMPTGHQPSFDAFKEDHSVAGKPITIGHVSKTRRVEQSGGMSSSPRSSAIFMHDTFSAPSPSSSSVTSPPTQTIYGTSSLTASPARSPLSPVTSPEYHQLPLTPSSASVISASDAFGALGLCSSLPVSPEQHMPPSPSPSSLQVAAPGMSAPRRTTTSHLPRSDSMPSPRKLGLSSLFVVAAESQQQQALKSAPRRNRMMRPPPAVVDSVGAFLAPPAQTLTVGSLLAGTPGFNMTQPVAVPVPSATRRCPTVGDLMSSLLPPPFSAPMQAPSVLSYSPASMRMNMFPSPPVNSPPMVPTFPSSPTLSSPLQRCNSAPASVIADKSLQVPSPRGSTPIASSSSPRSTVKRPSKVALRISQMQSKPHVKLDTSALFPPIEINSSYAAAASTLPPSSLFPLINMGMVDQTSTPAFDMDDALLSELLRSGPVTATIEKDVKPQRNGHWSPSVYMPSRTSSSPPSESMGSMSTFFSSEPEMPTLSVLSDADTPSPVVLEGFNAASSVESGAGSSGMTGFGIW
eukprot:CAMPEP_0184648852 /NCGR_PEP_ID=MMETSP0308-20130426/6088_1 /TAXON_ID=38269 /ORGANISM="Gloeochaete witrockiana, Strain SAG 46.84" /LENGTH=543 /DNA_ID=CAMNT_0027081089 /DNA_START=195 /DNA_END=1823 /DNA_ORIENTATION=+